MTPADRAMKSALEESIRYAGSPPRMASAAHPPLAGQPPINLTSFELRTRKSSEPTDNSLNTPVTPHITLHHFRKIQHSFDVSSSPDLDYKRVRRKQSFANLVRLPLESSLLPARATSPSPSLHSTSTQNFLPSFLPPLLPLTHIPRPSTTSPSLSSTVDTLQSTPTHTPIQHDSWPFNQFGGFERIELREPIRTKRKFHQFKQAKRLPHYEEARSNGGIWEVHAAVVDIGYTETGEVEKLAQEARHHVTETNSTIHEQATTEARHDSKPSGRKGRSVRFEGISISEGSSGTGESTASGSARSAHKKRSTPSSSYSLSKFQFPPPPGYAWTGTFAPVIQPKTPTSPATLHYRGASFDVVNPHSSLLLGNSDFETPAEIDGLLDDYFSREESATMQPYTDPAGDNSSSQQSLQTSTSEGRRRVLYDDPESARRRILRLPGSSSQQTVIASPYRESSLTDRADEPEVSLSAFEQHRPPTPVPFLSSSRNQAPRGGVQIHPNLRAALDLDVARGYNAHGEQYELVSLEHGVQGLGVREEYDADLVGTSNEGRSGRAIDRGSSIYPHSQLSDPFDLAISEHGDSNRHRNMDGVVRDARSSYYAGNGALYDQEENFAVYEDAPDANATQSTLEPETTLGNIVGHYNYSRPPLGTFHHGQADDDYDFYPTSSSVELERGPSASYNPFRVAEGGEFNTEAGLGLFVNSHLALRVENPSRFGFAHSRPRTHRVEGVPDVPLPIPPYQSGETSGPYGHYAGYMDTPTTDQTYGSTGQLLQLTPQTGMYPFSGPNDWDVYRQHRERAGRALLDTQMPTPRTPVVTPRAPAYDEDEDKENTTPPSTRADDNSTLSVTPTFPPLSEVRSHVRGPATVNFAAARVMPRSSSYYPDDESVWKSTQASESRVNVADLDEFSDVPLGDRPSQESYADTSVCPSNHRLSQAYGSAIPAIPSHLIFGDLPTRPAAPLGDDETRAYGILEQKLLEDTLLGGITPRRSKTEYNDSMRELEQLRMNNPSAVQKAVQSVANKLESMTPPRPIYSPHNSFSKAARLGSRSNTYDSPYTETQGLLEGRADSPYARRGILFSDNANTFNTVRRVPSLAVDASDKEYSPLSPPPITPPSNAFVRDRTATGSTRPSAATIRSVPDLPITESIEMKRLRPKKHVSRVAMSSQTELRPLELLESTGASAHTGRLTDAQLMEAEPGWTVGPDFSQSGALARLPGGNPGPGAFTVFQADGRLEQTSVLIRPDQARSMASEVRQKNLTRPYFRACICCPLTAVLFGLGCFDWVMKKVSKGEFMEMSPKAKKTALALFAPLGLVIYGAISVAITMIIIVENAS